MKRWTWIVLLIVGVLVAQQIKSLRNKSGALEILKPSLATAKEEGKTVMLVFTGSDWCTWCIKLESEILSQKTFKAYADEHLVMILADFPEDTSGLAEAEQKRNQILKSAYPVNGFPTVFLIDPEGKVLAKLGYQEGGPTEYVKLVKKVLASAR